VTTTVVRGRELIRRPPLLAVDVRGALHVVGVLIAYLSLSTLVPTGFAVGYSESLRPFLLAGAIVGAAGFATARLTRGEHRLGIREGFLVVSLTWLVAAVLGALPFLLSGSPQLDRPVDAYFEGMSGFSTTGGSIVTDVEALPRSLAIWRQLMQWFGGIGIIVLALAVLPRLRVGGRQLLEHEMPGPEIETLSMRIRDTAQRVWILYVGLTATLFGILLAIGLSGADDEMTPFQAFAHSLTTIPTAGFSTKNRSLEVFAPITQWVVVVFMILGGINFALMYRAIVRRRPRAASRDHELRLYFALLALGCIVLTAEIVTEDVLSGEGAIRSSVFTAVSTMTTTGFSVADYNTWPTLALMTIVGLMFVGGSAGSTTGSVKVVRHLLLGKILRREIDQTLHPEVVLPIRLNRRVVDERTLRAVSSFILIYIGIFILGAAAIAIDAARTGLEVTVLDAISISASMLGNVGPAFGLGGPLGSFEPFSDVSTIVMTVLMWLGRLEVLPIVVLLSRHYWRNA
jgi:trk system potassium uptake protein TrkH